ncbi:MAG: PH domain-containing protein [Phycisphaeraceae bacterium]|nr:PH domain-containing protein [Phycisphaeraceae bacterium]
MAQHPKHNPADHAKPTSEHALAAAEAGDAADAEPAMARANAMLPAELLQPGEIIILLIKPSPLYILLAPIRFIAIVLLCALLAVQLQKRGINLGLDRHDLIIAALGIIGVRLFWQMLDWLSHVYVLTDQRIIRVMGVLNVQVFECPLQKIQQTDLILPLIQRLFWLGSIGFATAGTAGHEAYWLMVAKPLEVHKKIIETLRRYRR